MTDPDREYKPLTSDEVAARATRAHLGPWLERATRGLGSLSVERMRRETYGHVASDMNNDGISEVVAVSRLGNPAKANRDFRKRFFTEADERSIYSEFGPSRFGWVWKTVSIGLMLVLIIAWIKIIEPDPGRTAALILWVSIFYCTRRVTIRSIAKSTDRTAVRFLVWSIRLWPLGLIVFWPLLNELIFAPIVDTSLKISIYSAIFLFALPFTFWKYRKHLANPDDTVAIIKRAWEEETCD